LTKTFHLSHSELGLIENTAGNIESYLIYVNYLYINYN